MIPLGLRLVLSGGREAVTRLVVLAVAVGLGVGLLLTAVAATNAVSAWNGRNAWLWTGTAVGARPARRRASPRCGGTPAATSSTARRSTGSTWPPPVPRRPCRRASPGTRDLASTTPLPRSSRCCAAPRRASWPTATQATWPASIGDAALPSPNSLIIIVGRTPAQLAQTPNTVRVTSIATTVPGNPGSEQSEVNPQGLAYMPANGGAPASASDLILSVVALAILAPVLIFIATATRLSAARREQRFAAMRLAGATRKQVSVLAATESTVAGILGVAVGFGIFFLLRTPVAGIPFIGTPFFPGDLSLSLLDVLVVAIGVPLAAAVAARLALHRVRISPLGVARRATPKPPRAWRTVPLLAGLAELGFWAVRGHPASISGQVQAFVSSFALIIVGLFIAGPWLTMAAARVMARWTSRPGTLIAARRLADDPRAAFRAVSGLVLALFISTVAVVAITTQTAKDLTRFGSVTESHVLTDQVSASNQVAGNSAGGARQGTAAPGPAAPVAPLTAQLSGIPGVQGVLVVRADPGLTIPAKFHDLGVNQYGPPTPIAAGLVSCAQLATVPVLGRCPAGATAAAFPADGFNGPLGYTSTDFAAFTWPAASLRGAPLDTLGVDAIDVQTDGSTPAVEQARTLLENAHAYPGITTPSTIADLVAQDNSQNSDYQQLANVVILISLPIAGCTLAAGIAAGLADRKRPFSLLRLTGARLATLRRVVALEGAVPLLAVAAVAIGTGFGAAAMFATEAQNHPMVAPGVAYYLLTAGGILVSLGIIAATFPLLARITGPEVARNE